MGFARVCMSLVCAGFVALLIFPTASADSVTSGSVVVTGFDLSVASGTVGWGVWTFSTGAHAANNIDGGTADDPALGDDPDESAFATTPPYATAQASGETVLAMPELEVSSNTSIVGLISGLAEADAHASAFGSFIIDGGSPDSTTEVTFNLDFVMNLFGSVDEFGDFEQTTYVMLRITDFDDETYTFDDFQHISDPPSTFGPYAYSPGLTNPGGFALHYGTTYDVEVFANIQSLSVNVVPEPTTAVLSGLGFALVALRRGWRARFGRS